MSEDARRALALYRSGQYAACGRVLEALGKRVMIDAPKVRLNAAVVRFAAAGSCQVAALLHELCDVEHELEREGQADPAGWRTVSELSLVRYNRAVALYQARCRPAAAEILEGLFATIQPIDDVLAVRICLLLADVAIERADIGTASRVLVHADRTAPADAPPELRLALQLGKARVHLLARSVKAAKREIKAASLLPAQSPAVVVVKAQLEYMRGNHRKSAKLLNSTLQQQQQQQQQQEQQEQQEQQQQQDNDLAMVYFCNLGSIHYGQQKYAAAAHYYSRALSACGEMLRASTGSDDVAVPLGALARSRRPEILFNLGLQLLLLREPCRAFACLHEASADLAHAKVWYRLGEACVAQYVHGILARQRANLCLARVADSVSDVLLLPTTPTQGSHGLTEPLATAAEMGGDGDLALTMTLDYAVRCFQTALFLQGGSDDPAAAAATAAASSTDAGSADPGDDVPDSPVTPSSARSEASAPEAVASHLESSCHANIAYASLVGADPVTAYRSAQALLAVPQQTPLYRYLGNVYAAEALLLMSRPEDALTHLSLDNFDPNDLEGTPDFLYSSKQLAAAPHHVLSRAVLLVNTAAALVVLKDADRALQCALQAIELLPQNPYVILATAFVFLRRGDHTQGLSLLQNRRLAVQ